ncbi:unhealthy ribosome biogenesis protein 2 homolog isoform X1 [Anarhichas minor]|uniref:unhealthy ribosome biogenesis protein 2 homolog isoform X1 n=1 Tax=Anarhichas minor TaxID=65739 RepID=UPI003F73525F
MAAMYSGIHLKLKSPQTPWEDKLKLARFAWVSNQCLLPNKEQVLLDWCTHALTGRYSQKVEFSQNVLEGLWFYLDDLLHSRKLHSLLKQGKTVSLRLNMAQLLLERLQECARVGPESMVCASTILSVCQGLLSSPALSSVFTTKYELIVDLLAKLCTLACRELQQPLLTEPPMTESVTSQDEVMTECLQPQPASDLDSSQIEPIIESSPDQPELEANKSPPKPKENIRSAHLFEVLLQVLSCYLSVQRQQANPNRVFTMVTNQLIQPLILLRHLLTSGEFAPSHTHLHLRQQLSRDIRVKIDSILQLALFPSEHLTSYKEELLPSKEDSGKRGPGGAKGPLKPVSAILSKLSARGYCEPLLHYAVKSNTLPLLFKFFLESYAKGRGSEEAHRMLCFYFLTRLVPALEVCLDGRSLSPADAEQPVSVSAGQKSPPLCSPESWSLALLAVESLLSQALSADIYNVAADRIRHEEVQLKFYRALEQMLFNQAQPSIPAWYRCLRTLLSLNHLILEPDLDQLLSSAWVHSECMDARVQRARQIMVCSLLQTYTKLRQLPRLFSELLSVICQPALDDLRPLLLSESVSASLRTCLLDTPASQGLEICSSVLESIRGYILPGLVREDREEKMEIDGGGNDKGENKEIKVDLEREDASMKLFSLSHLLHVVLFSLKTLDSASPLPIVRQSQGLMEVMQQVAKELLHLLLTEKKAGKANVSSVKGTPRKGKNTVDLKESEEVALWEQKIQEAALLLRYTWVEVDTLFSIHCSKYTSLQTAPASETEGGAPALTHIISLLSGEIVPARLQPSRRPMSCLLLKLLTLQQMKKVLLDTSLLSEPSTAAQLNTAAQFILAKSELEASVDGEQVWDGQIASVNAGSYHVAHWYLVTSNLPLIAPHLSGEDVGCVADMLVNSLLSRQTGRGKEPQPGCLTFSLVSSQLLQSPVLAELPSVFSATMCSLTQRIISVLKAAHVTKVCPTLLKFPEKGVSAHREAIVEDILASSKTGEVFVLLTDTQSKDLVDILQVLTNLNPDGMNSEDFSSIFLLLFFMLTSTSSQLDQVDAPGSGDDVLFLLKLLRVMTCLLEGRNFQSVLKLIYGGTLLQASVSSLLWHSNNGRFQATGSSQWLDLIKAVQSFIRSLVQLIIVRNSSVRLNLDQFASYLTSMEMSNVQIVASSSDKPDPGASILSVHLLLASLTSFSQAMASHLGRSKPMDQTLTRMLTRTTASLGPAVESVLKPQTVSQSVIQPASILGQAFVVEVVTVMLHCELSTHSVDDENENNTRLTLSHMTLYQGFCRQIFKEISCAHRPLDFLVSSLHFLSAFYKAVERTGGEREEEQGKEKKEGKDLDELYMQILQNVHRLLAASWLSESDVCELEPAVQELLRHLVEKSTTGRFNLLLLLIREGLVTGKLRAGNYREVLSAAIITKLLSCCQLPEPCTKALWLIAPQIISAMVFLVKSSAQDVSLTLTFTVPTVTSMTSLLRQGEGLITNPHHVILVLGALQLVPLHHLTPTVYQSAFLAVHEALFAIIQCHPQVMLNAAPSFLNVFYRLVASIMQEGRQRGDSDTDGDVYLQCSRLIERMYSHIAATAESFTTLSAFMVAQYVTELQKVTLRPDVKLHLTEGIYRILDLCVEQDIKFLTAGLQMGVREVFNELYSSYTHYHKAQRQGEDKYTV